MQTNATKLKKSSKFLILHKTEWETGIGLFPSVRVMT